MTDPTPTERMTAGYAATQGQSRDRVASAYRPKDDQEADRLAALGEELPTAARLALGYHDSARQAATHTTKENH